MRTPFLQTAILLSSLSLSLCAAAQKFQEPTKEELQMTSDPKSPGAAAVYLDREESADNRSHYVSHYARIKVLTELGKEWATVEVPYSKGYTAVPIIEARTIHSDGTVIPLVGKADDLLVFKTVGNHLNAAVFNMPSVEVGSILEYKWTIPLTGGNHYGGEVLEAQEGTVASEMASTTPQWEVQTPLFVHKEHFYFNPFNDLEASLGSQFLYITDGERANFLVYSQNLPTGAQVAKSPKNDYSLDVHDVPPIPRESDTPPESSFRYRVRFYYTPYTSSQVYWENEVVRWSKQVTQFAAQTPAIKEAADQITAGGATPDAKARKLYDAVQALDNTNFSRAKSEEERKKLGLKRELKKVQDVWSEKSGSANDMAALYLALARAAGLEVYAVKVADRDRRIFDPNLLSLHQLDSLLVVLRIDGKDVFLDPGQKLCPYGQLHWTHMLAGGLQENVKAPIFTPPNLGKDALTSHSADLTLDDHGTVTGTVKVLMNGPEALRWRQLGLTDDATEVEKRFNESLKRLLPAGISGELDHFQGMDTPATNLLAVVKVSGRLGNPTGKRLLVPAFFFSTGAHKQFVSETTRTLPIDLHYAEQVVDDVIYHLPSGFTVESAPQPTQLPWPEHAALVTKTTSAPGVIDIKHIFARAFVVLDTKQYPALRDFYQKLATNDQQQLVLSPAPTTAGN
jgi:hypothetical protein